MLRIGVLSDTHGLLRPQALAQLQGCDQRFKLPVSLAECLVDSRSVTAQVIELEI